MSMDEFHLREFVGGPYDGMWGFIPGSSFMVPMKRCAPIVASELPVPTAPDLAVGLYQLTAWVAHDDFTMVWKWQGET